MERNSQATITDVADEAGGLRNAVIADVDIFRLAVNELCSTVTQNLANQTAGLVTSQVNVFCAAVFKRY